MDPSQFLIIAFAAVAVVWTMWLALSASMLDACLLAIVAASCFGVSFGSWDIGPITTSCDRLFLIALVAIAACQRLLTIHSRIQFTKQDALLAAFLGFLVISVATHSWSPNSPTDMPPWFRLINSFLAPALVYWIVRFRLGNEMDVQRLCRFCWIFAVYIAATAVCEAHAPSLVFPRYIVRSSDLYEGRAMGPFLSAPTVGTWITIGVVALLLSWNQLGVQLRLLAASSVPLLCYAEYLCKTRSAWIGFVIAVPLVLIRSRPRIPRPALLFGLTACLLVSAVYVGEDFILPQRAEGRSVVARSANQRIRLAEDAWRLFQSSPLTGVGFGQFERALGRSAPAATLSSHNILLRMLAETGLIGSLLFCLLYGNWFWQAQRCTLPQPGVPAQQRDDFNAALLFTGAFIAYWSEAMFHDPTHMMIGNLTLFLFAAVARSGSPCPLPTKSHSPAARISAAHS